MRFVKEQVDLKPIVDTVFAIVKKAKEAKQEIGEENVVDATIGSLYDEHGKIVAFDSVFSTLKQLPNEVMAAYAGSFTGNPNYREHVWLETEALCRTASLLLREEPAPSASRFPKRLTKARR